MNGMQTGVIAGGLDLLLKATVVLALAWGVHLGLGRRRALARSAVWDACLVGLVMLPLASAVMPRLRVDWLPVERVERESGGARQASGEAGVMEEAIGWYERNVVEAGAETAPMPSRLEQSGGVEAPTIEPEAGKVASRGGDGGSDGMSATSWLVMIAAIAYAGVAGMLGVRLAVGLGAIGRLRRSSRPVEDGAWTEDLERWRTRLGIRRAVGLATSERVGVPMVMGWRRPLVVIPAGMERGASDEARDAVLLHELAHVKRGDYAWNLLARLVSAVYWVHPLVWPAGKVIRGVREQACDDLCVRLAGGAERYRSALIAIAGATSRRPGPAIGLAMAGRSGLSRRLSWIDRTEGSSRCLSRWPVRVGAIAGVVGVAGMVGVVELSRAKGQGPGAVVDGSPDVVEVTVTAADTGKPIEGASVWYPVDFETVTVRTDGKGKARIDLSGRKLSRGNGALYVDAWVDGYVQHRSMFDEEDPRYGPIPEEFAVALEPGSRDAGGIVKNEEGRPIEGVTVELWGYLAEKKQPGELVWKVPATTDAEGRWRTRSLRPMQWVNLYLTHPDYVSDHYRSRAADPLDKLYSGLDEQVMVRGVSVAGRVVDSEGRPIAGSDVGWTTDRNGFPFDVPRVSTNERGEYRISHAKPGELFLVAERKGYAPSLSTVRVAAGEPEREVNFKLEPGRVFRGRVVDTEGKPVEGARVNAATWRGARMLRDMFLTDAEGRFRWESAPPDGVIFGVAKDYYRNASEVEEKIAGDEVEFTVEPAMRWLGTLRDAETGKRVDEADLKIEIGRVDQKGEVAWTEWKYRMASGLVEVPIQGAKKIALRLLGKGYAPFESEAFEAGQRLVQFEGKLSREVREEKDLVRGFVRRPDGSAVEGATVVVATDQPRVHVNLQGGKLPEQRGYVTAVTDADGRFELPGQAGTFSLLAAAAEGFAEVTSEELKKSEAMVLRPWGRIEGRVCVGTGPAGGLELSLFSRGDWGGMPTFGNSGEAVADAAGRFRFDHVLPGHVQINSRGSGEPTNRRDFRSWKVIEVKEGETTRAEIGGKGRPVVGRIAAPEGFGRQMDFSVREIRLSLDSNIPLRFVPLDVVAGAKNSRELAERKPTPEDRARTSDRVHIGTIRMSEDGAFRIEDVPAGWYSIVVDGRAPENVGADGQRLAPLRHFFHVPEMAGGRSDEPLDLGEIGLKFRGEAPEVGDMAPAFTVETLDGRKVGPEDYRGKVLLLNFWAPWDSIGGSLYLVPDLRNLRRDHGPEELAILSLCPDESAAGLRRVVESVGLPGDVAFLGQWSTSRVLADYDVDHLPRLMLIGRDGKIVETELRKLMGDALEETVRKQLEGKPGE